MTKKKRAIALLLGLLLLSAMILSAVFIAEEAGHDCVGSGCPVCRGIRLCLQTLNLLGMAAAASTALAATCFAGSPTARRYSGRAFFYTLIRQKVRLND